MIPGSQFMIPILSKRVKKYHYFLLTLLFTMVYFVTTGSCQSLSKVWVSDLGNGTYRNPVLHADYSDPDVIRAGNKYYMTASSFNCMPGLPILESEDLVNWKITNYAIKRLLPESMYQTPQHGKGVWAPAIRYHNNQFYIFYPDPDYGIFMIKANDPNKEWTKPVSVMAGKGIIDPCPFWDKDGKAYLVVGWAASRAGVNSLLTIFQMVADGTHVLDEGKHVYDGHEQNHTIEGPKLYRENSFYYIFAPAGGVSTGWQVVLRSKNIYGPYEQKVVLHQGKTNINGPHQGAWVKTPSGESWFLHFQDKGPYGRVLFLEPMRWKDDWPLIGKDIDGDGIGEPVSSYRKPCNAKATIPVTPAENDEFENGLLGKQWQWQANPQITWYSLLKGTGYLRLFAFPQLKDSVTLWAAPNLLLQKFPAPAFTFSTSVKLNIEWDIFQSKKAGLVVMGNDYASLYISKDKDGYKVSASVCREAFGNGEEKVIEEQKLTSPSVFLKVQVTAPDAVCHFLYSEDGHSFKTIGNPFTALQDKWVGAKVGIFSVSDPGVRTGGYADFDWIRISPAP